MQLKDKVAIITGAARGLGRAYAEAMAREGAAVAVGDVRDCDATVAAIREAGGRAIGMSLDAAMREYGRIDALVNNAALYGDLKGGRFDQLSEDQWDRVMQVNIKGVWNCCRAVIPHMRTNKAGSVINISSLAPVYGMPYALDYSVSKGAVIALTRSLARELGRDWIRVNAIAPSAVMTEGTRDYFGDKLEKASQVIAAGQTLQRNLQTEDLTGTVIYLASDASRFVTGQTIMVDGGTVFL